MDFLRFENKIAELYQYFRLKDEPHDLVVQDWYSQVKGIPNKPFNDLVEDIKQQHKSMPRNIPYAIRTAWRDWKNRNADKMTKQFEKRPCHECDGKGLLWATKKDDKSKIAYRYVFRCKLCENWRRHLGSDTAKGIQPVTVAMLRANGYKVWIPDPTKSNRPKE